MTDLVSKEKLRAIRASIEKAFAEVAKEHNMDNLSLGKISFDQDGFTSKIEGRFVGGDSLDMKSLKANARLLGFTPEIAGAKINYSKKEFIVTGVRRTKLILEQVSDGKTYLASIDDVSKVLKTQNSPLIAENPFALKRGM